MTNESLVLGLNIQPTYAVLYPSYHHSKYIIGEKWEHIKKERTKSQIETEQNLRSNVHKGYLSEKASKKLLNACNWFVISAKEKTAWSKKNQTTFRFKINFVTLTIPSEQADFSDNFIKSKCLQPLLSYLRVQHGLKSYVWKCEAQSNGNLHIHLITDIFIDHLQLRNAWNRILSRAGLMAGYTEKFSKIKKSEYFDLLRSVSKMSVESILKAWHFGVASGWTSPNTTDVHAMKNVKDLGAYLASYMSKKDITKRPIQGKIWGCSEALAVKNNPKTLLFPNLESKIYDYLVKCNLNWKEITVKDKVTQVTRTVAKIVFYEPAFLMQKINNEFFRFVNEYRYKVRYNISTDLTI